MYEPRTLTFVVPSGATYTIREQNGEDEDILSNQMDLKNNKALSKFLAAIICSKGVEGQETKVNVSDILDMPLLDKYAIIFKSRIFSLGENLEFSYKWDEETTLEYEQNLLEYLYDDYAVIPNEETLNAKPLAIPYYPLGDKLKDIEATLSSGKKIKFDIANGHSELFLLNLPESKRSRNSELLAHNLHLEVDGKFEKVQNFRLFSARDMAEIRTKISAVDPNFDAITEITNPETGASLQFPLMTSPNFFFLTGV